MKAKFIFINLLCALLLITSCDEHKQKKKEVPKLLVTSPIKKDTLISKDYVCQIHSIRHIELKALEKGYLKQIFVDEGQKVKKGQKMFQIMPNIYKAELLEAEAEAKRANIELKNTKLLAKNKVVSQNELAMAEANVEKANAKVMLAQTHLNFTHVNAPFDGIMNLLRVREGSLVDEGELLTSLSDNSKMWVYFNVPEAEYLDYIANADKNEKKQVELLLANNKMFDQVGIVETIEGEFNNETGNIAFRATFPNPKGILRHGETGSVILKSPYKNAILIPQKSTFDILDKTYVFVVNKDNIVKQREIIVEAELQDIYIVKKGLSENDNIILEGIRKVKDNEEIEIEYEEPSKVFSSLSLYAE